MLAIGNTLMSPEVSVDDSDTAARFAVGDVAEEESAAARGEPVVTVGPATYTDMYSPPIVTVGLVAGSTTSGVMGRGEGLACCCHPTR